MALIDSHQFTRECFISAAFSMQPMLAFTPYASVGEFAGSSIQSVDLVVYVHHGAASVGLEDVTAILRYVPPRCLIVISDWLTEDSGHLLNEFETRSAAVVQARHSSLQKTVSTFYLVHHGRQGSISLPVQHDSWMSQRETMPLRHGYASRVEVSDLTRRERMVLEHVRQGESNKEIAEGLIMSISTVKAHVRNIMQKTGATNRIQLALNAERYSGQAN
ncbi:response regulator transcription factor [Acidisoma silvae]|nr:response regulator transcription factor [Acidisoma silvae]